MTRLFDYLLVTTKEVKGPFTNDSKFPGNIFRFLCLSLTAVRPGQSNKLGMDNGSQKNGCEKKLYWYDQKHRKTKKKNASPHPIPPNHLHSGNITLR